MTGTSTGGNTYASGTTTTYYSGNTTTGTSYNNSYGYITPNLPPRMIDCLGKDIKEGDKVIYSKGVYGFLHESVIERFTSKSVILMDGYRVSFSSLNKLRKIW